MNGVMPSTARSTPVGGGGNGARTGRRAVIARDAVADAREASCRPMATAATPTATVAPAATKKLRREAESGAAEVADAGFGRERTTQKQPEHEPARERADDAREHGGETSSGLVGRGPGAHGRQHDQTGVRNPPSLSTEQSEDRTDHDRDGGDAPHERGFVGGAEQVDGELARSFGCGVDQRLTNRHQGRAGSGQPTSDELTDRQRQRIGEYSAHHRPSTGGSRPNHTLLTVPSRLSDDPPTFY